MRYLPDTNIFIRALYGLDPEASFLKKAIQTKKVVISVVSVAEFLPRAEREEKAKFNRLLKALPIIPVDIQTAKIAAKYRGQYLRKSKRVFLLDCFIAAQAKIHNLVLVTHDKSDFPMKDIKIITPAL